MAIGVTARPNFLLIVVDDLRTTLGCYNDVNAYTPYVDALAKDGVLFNEAFAQVSYCLDCLFEIYTRFLKLLFA